MVRDEGRLRKAELLSFNVTLSTPAITSKGTVRLPSATIAGVAVRSAKALEFTGLNHQRPLMSTSVDVRFGTLSRDQFDALKAEFGGRSRVPYDAKREYSAIDFLPPTLQALVNKDLDGGAPVTIPKSKALNRAFGNEGRDEVSIGLSPNCHGTSWEAMRAFQNANSTHIDFMYGEAVSADNQFVDAKVFTPLGTAEDAAKADFLKDLKPGDVVAFRRGEWDLLHTSTYVGGGLFFEKPDTESDEWGESPYRLATYAQVVAPIREFLEAQPRAAAYRPIKTLPSGPSVFGSPELEAELEAFAKKQGKAVGRQVVGEIEYGMGGGARGFHLSAVETKRVQLDTDGRGVVR